VTVLPPAASAARPAPVAGAAAGELAAIPANPLRALFSPAMWAAWVHLVDGGQVVTAFLAAELIKELTISRAPVILGAGLPLFHALPHPVRLAHLGTSTTESGMTNTRYRVTATSDT